jgi:hypothetical protein
VEEVRTTKEKKRKEKKRKEKKRKEKKRKEKKGKERKLALWKRVFRQEKTVPQQVKFSVF